MRRRNLIAGGAVIVLAAALFSYTRPEVADRARRHIRMRDGKVVEDAKVD